MVNYVCIYNYIHFNGSEINSLVLETRKRRYWIEVRTVYNVKTTYFFLRVVYTQTVSIFLWHVFGAVPVRKKDEILD